jgi:hypothetical protein
MRNNTTKEFKRIRNVAAPILFILLLSVGNIRSLVYGALYNIDTLATLKSVGALTDEAVQNLQTWPLTGRFMMYQELFPCAAGSFYVWLAIQADDPELASIPFANSPCVQSRYTFPDINWKMSNWLLTGGNRGWFNQRQIAVYTMFLNALHEQKSGELQKALTWFQKGLVLAPGRVPDLVRRNYYIVVAEWYGRHSQSIRRSRELSKKAFCLVRPLMMHV